MNEHDAARDDKATPRSFMHTRLGDIKFNYASRGKSVCEGVEIPVTKRYYNIRD